MKSDSVDPSRPPFWTHDIANQPPPLGEFNLFSADACLREAVEREGAGWASAALAGYGETLGHPHLRDLAGQANTHSPVLHTHDRYGRRIDEVEFHPAWHELLGTAVAAGAHAYDSDSRLSGAEVARAAAFYLTGQIENGIQCPLSMTHAAIPLIARYGDAAAGLEQWLPILLSRSYDPRPLPVAQKRGALLGMGMTEKQGGSDVRSNSSIAEPTGSTGIASYRIVGHKWFFSAPMCDAHLVLANTDGGLSCFLVPRVLPDGSRNAIRLQRLKDKLGNRSNASSEVEFQGAFGCLLGEEGRGIPTIIEMATRTRLDCVLGSAGMLRRALIEAIHHAQHRIAFGRRLIEQPLMKNLLADLSLESEASTAAGMRLAKNFENGSDEAAHLRRVLTPALKYWVCKRGITFAGEAMEVLGGNGYVEDSGMPRIFREMPLNSIWEGSGNVMCLDVLRALRKDGACAAVLLMELETARGGNRHLDAAIARLKSELVLSSDLTEADGRRLAESIALAFCASLLVRFSPAPLSEAYCASRLGADRSLQPGALPPGTAWDDILARSTAGIAPEPRVA